MNTPDPRVHHWEQRYDTEDYIFGTEPAAFLLAQAQHLQPGQRALAVADGEGRNGVWLARQGLEVVSVEASDNALKKARQLAAQHAVTVLFEQANLLHWQWPEASFDVVAALFIQFLTPPERAQVFAAMRAALKPGGLLLLQGYGLKQLDYRTGGPSVPEQLYTPQLMRELLSGMELLLLREHEMNLDEGHHAGRSALIDVVARQPA